MTLAVGRRSGRAPRLADGERLVGEFLLVIPTYVKGLFSNLAELTD